MVQKGNLEASGKEQNLQNQRGRAHETWSQFYFLTLPIAIVQKEILARFEGRQNGAQNWRGHTHNKLGLHAHFILLLIA